VADHLERERLLALPIVPFAALRPQLRTGDLLFISGNYASSTRIRAFTHSPWSHVGLILQLPILDRVLLLESVEQIGVRLIPLSKYMDDYDDGGKPYDGVLVVARVEGVTQKTAQGLMQFGADELGRPYNQEEIAVLFDPDALQKGRPPAGERVYVCSELIQACFHHAGLDFPNDPGGFISPENIWADARVSLLARIL
jgi:hypothetical protein